MRTPKALTQFAEANGVFIEVLRFHAHGQHQKGFAVVDADSNELVEIAPVHYSNGDRWKVSNRTKKEPGLIYLKSLRAFNQPIKPGWTGWKFRGVTKGTNGKIYPFGVAVRS